LFANKGVEARTIPDQRAHIRDRRSLSHLGALDTWSGILPMCCGFTRQAALVNLKVGGRENAEISGNAITCGESDKVTRDGLICEEV